MSDRWSLEESGALTGAMNMARDEEMALRLLRGEGTPALRLYRWNPWAVSLGFHQNEADVDRERCRADGIDVVRRPTGGRAILHAEELTYAVVMTAQGTLMEVYRRIALALLAGLKDAGVEAELERTQPDFARSYRAATPLPCFGSAARHEILWRGKKIVGSAQRRYRGDGREVVLQHGSILTGRAHERLADYLAVPPAMRATLRATLREKTADISSITGRPVDLSVLAAGLRRGFEREFGVVITPPPSSTPSGRSHAPEKATAA